MIGNYKFSILYVFLILVLPIVLFFTRGIAFPEGIYGILLCNLVLLFLFWKKLEVKKYKKLIFISSAIVVSLLSPFIVIFVLVNTPMQKKADDILFNVCFPKIRKYYGVSKQEMLPEKPVDKDGNPKWWIQVRECEQNVWDGKGPVFSKDPKGFIPVSETK